MNSKVLYLIFGDLRNQNNDDLDDLCRNILHFNPEAEIVINHPTATHPLVKLRHVVQPVNQSTFIFGVLLDFLDYISEAKTDFDHVCLYSANQYTINRFNPILGVNYLQYYNCSGWDDTYTGKDFSNLTVGTPLIHGTLNWDDKNMHSILGVDNAMVSNWESAFLTKETIDLCIKHKSDCTSIYPGRDCIQLFPAFMALKSGQPWLFPPFFGTFDPSNKINGHNLIITQSQIDQKHKEGYAFVKRVNYSKDCPLKQYIKNNYEN